jgi:hypothetical protein
MQASGTAVTLELSAETRPLATLTPTRIRCPFSSQEISLVRTALL